ncbi:MAG: class I SAM-dependent methyltransferase [Paracoccaceae bacterium]
MNFKIFSDNNPNITARLEERYKRIITKNIDAIAGKHVLDLAANNGRWTYAALEAGAAFVTSIEGRDDRAKDATKFLHDLGYDGKYEANVGDMYDFLHEKRNTHYDTVFCLGVYYHIMDHYHLLKSIARTKPNTIIIDSGFVRSFRSSVHVQYENPGLHLNALKLFEGQKAEPVGFVSLGLMIQMAWNLGYDCRPVAWVPDEVTAKSDVHDYMMGRRFTLRLNKIAGHTDEGWKEAWMPALTALNGRFAALFDRKTHDNIMDNRARESAESASFTLI